MYNFLYIPVRDTPSTFVFTSTAAPRHPFPSPENPSGFPSSRPNAALYDKGFEMANRPRQCLLAGHKTTARLEDVSSQRVFRQWRGVAVHAVILTRTQRVSTWPVDNVAIHVRARLGLPLSSRRGFWWDFFIGWRHRRLRDFLKSSTAFGGDVGRVVEVKEEKQHRPGVVERDAVEQPRVITVGTNEHVVAGMTYYCHKLYLQDTSWWHEY